MQMLLTLSTGSSSLGNRSGPSRLHVTVPDQLSYSANLFTREQTPQELNPKLFRNSVGLRAKSFRFPIVPVSTARRRHRLIIGYIKHSIRRRELPRSPLEQDQLTHFDQRLICFGMTALTQNRASREHVGQPTRTPSAKLREQHARRYQM